MIIFAYSLHVHGKPICLECRKPITHQTIQEMADQILKKPKGTKLQILAPVVRGRKGEYKNDAPGFCRSRIYSRPN